ncbi:unnamed protein product [Brugia timori]|uniref:Uncharacterized protein n=1 Tax=Brugia timori TaxID=42155 RepID=A0A0R3RBZ8_9BILA|nr:unnamed protein product [Brugia timori]
MNDGNDLIHVWTNGTLLYYYQRINSKFPLLLLFLFSFF